MNQMDCFISQEIKNRLSEIVSLIEIKVFGSRARGDYTEDSDMDVFVKVEKLDKSLKEKIYNIVWEIGFRHSVFISVLIFTKNELENTAMRSSPIVKSIKEEGITV